MIQRISELPEQQFYEFLSSCMSPMPDRIQQESQLYQTSEERELYGLMQNDSLAGLVGIIREDQDIVIKHIAVHPNYRLQGIGSELIQAVKGISKSKSIVAETDHEAVQFYEKNGFSITSLGEKYPGVERFLCIYRL